MAGGRALSAAQEALVAAWVESGPDAAKDGVVRWRRADLGRVIEREFSVLDGVGWHQSGGQLRVPGNISLLPLPPYSPELNTVENIWRFLRQNDLANRVFDTYDAIVDACRDAWNALRNAPGKIQTITSRNWAENVRT